MQAEENTSFTEFINTEANRIDTSVRTTQIKFLCKFTNDMTGMVFYCYPESVIYDRYTSLAFVYSPTPNLYGGTINLYPAGYYHYEVYEVTWKSAPSLMAGRALATELDVLLPAASNKGIVQGIVAIGKLFLDEQRGVSEVQYLESGGSVITLDVTFGGSGYGVAPLVTIVGTCISQATATCTILAGSVDTVTIVYAGNGYSENPTVTLSNVGETETANIVASIQEHNYIYTS